MLDRSNHLEAFVHGASTAEAIGDIVHLELPSGSAIIRVALTPHAAAVLREVLHRAVIAQFDQQRGRVTKLPSKGKAVRHA